VSELCSKCGRPVPKDQPFHTLHCKVAQRYELAALIGRAAIIDGQLNRVSPVGLGFVWSPDRGGFHRGDYSMEDARTVVDWLNGQDRRLVSQVDRVADRNDPGRPPKLRGVPGRFNLSERARRE
jgi:hypothetical protein